MMLTETFKDWMVMDTDENIHKGDLQYFEVIREE